ncbi:SCAN domain-containing SCAND2P [Labeo rohita]|uniref:SCAN domain-containing SCAND2P n=1 Tax=Labeo rohita TaxID=84645 RepID=A0A498NFL7_LABRO|nr:SCAN domain-containing SCAND2P [Labeo rohita]RXN30505.1 SCAN domain-containing SCAND2P [Labeo rohita]
MHGSTELAAGEKVGRTCTSLSKLTLPSSFLPLNFVTLVPKPGKEVGTPWLSSPSSSQFAEVIHSITGLHQEHHQALLDMREDQKHRYQALVQTQQEDHKLFRSWFRLGELHLPRPCQPTWL